MRISLWFNGLRLRLRQGLVKQLIPEIKSSRGIFHSYIDRRSEGAIKSDKNTYNSIFNTLTFKKILTFNSKAMKLINKKVKKRMNTLHANVKVIRGLETIFDFLE
jgi:hypothetical protein